jgi:hypothetical protein
LAAVTVIGFPSARNRAERHLCQPPRWAYRQVASAIT